MKRNFLGCLLFILFVGCNSSNKKNNLSAEHSGSFKKEDTIVIANKQNFNQHLWNEIQQQLDKEKIRLIQQLLDLFEKNFVTVKMLQDIFGETPVEEESLFFKGCDVKYSPDHCNQLYLSKFKDITKCESFIFKEIKKNELVKELFAPSNKEFILSSLSENGKYYQATVGDKTVKFRFRMNEAQTKLIIGDFFINDQSIFWGMFSD